MTKRRPGLRKLLALSGAERRVFLESVALMTLTAVGLRLFGLRRVYRWMSRHGRRRTMAQAGSDGAFKQLAEAGVRRAARPLPYATCLPQSLTLWWLLQRRGIESDLRLGVQKEGEELKAHAWVEVGGVALNEHGDVRHRYSAFEVLQLNE